MRGVALAPGRVKDFLLYWSSFGEKRTSSVSCPYQADFLREFPLVECLQLEFIVFCSVIQDRHISC
jgi:hypothetical protein